MFIFLAFHTSICLPEEEEGLDVRDLVAVRKVRKPVLLKVTGIVKYAKKGVEFVALQLESSDVHAVRSNMGYPYWPRKLTLHATVFEKK